MAIFQDIYSKFVGRDIFGKAAPGAILLWTSAGALTSPTATVDFFGRLGWPAWLVFLGPSWLVGWAIQNVGRLSGLIRYYPDPEEFFRVQMPPLVARLKDEARAQIERTVILKEASGNAVVSFLVSGAVAAIDVVSFHREWLAAQWQLAAVLTCAAATLAVGLFWAHCDNVLDQQQQSLTAIAAEPSITDEERDAFVRQWSEERNSARRDGFRLLLSLNLVQERRSFLDAPGGTDTPS